MIFKNKVLYILLIILFVFSFKNPAIAADPTPDGVNAVSDQSTQPTNQVTDKLNDVNSCTCGIGTNKSCVQLTNAEIAAKKCADICVKKIGAACPVNTSIDLKNLQQTAGGVLNKVPFKGGLAGAQQLIAMIINFSIFPIGMFAMVFYIWAGFLWMSGSSENIEKAKTILMWVTLGIIVTLSAYLLVQFVFSIL